MINQSYTAVVELNQAWTGQFSSEPYEVAWAKEAIFFIRGLEVANLPGPVKGFIQISPDGMHWSKEGSSFELPSQPEETTFGRVSHFGGWLRLVGELPPGATIKVIVYLALKA